MASLSVSDIAAILKERYPTGLPIDRVYDASPFLGIIPKDKELAYGENIKVPIRYAHPQGASATFATGQTNQVGSKQSAFKVTTVNYYGFGQIDGEALAKGSRDMGSFIRTLETEVDGAFYTVTRALTNYIFGNQGGAIGRISSGSTVGSATITLANPSDAINFERGMILKSSTADGTSGAVKGGSVTILGVDRSAGTLTATGNWSAGIGTVAVNDYLFREGDFGAVMAGVRAWVPDSAPSATTFYQVDRSVDTRLGGLRADLSSYTIREAVQRAMELCHREGSKTDFGVLHSLDHLSLSLALQGAGAYNLSEIKTDAGTGIKAITVVGPRGECQFISDPNAPKGRLLMGQRDTWKLCTMGDMVTMLDDDSLPFLRVAAADAIEMRLVSRGNLICTQPGLNGNFQIA